LQPEPPLKPPQNPGQPEDRATGEPLVRRCLEGDPAAFRQLYDCLRDSVHQRCLHILGHAEDAEDAVQLSFVTVFRRLETFRGEGSLRAWVLQVANRCAQRVRRRRRHGFVSLDSEEAMEVPADPEPVRDEDRLRILQREIQRLPEKARQVFELHAIEELTHVEIGRILGISEGTSKSQLNYARSLLKQRLERRSRDLT